MKRGPFRFKLPSGVLIVDILTVLLVLSIVFIPSTPVRIVLGVPFLLFFPGYALVAALFTKEAEMDAIERVALSGGMSIAVVGLIGFGLNYTPWGIRLGPVLFFNAAFVFLMSALALIRKSRRPGAHPLTMDFVLSLPGWGGSKLNKSLTVVLSVAILGALGVLGYTIAMPKVGERFTEFYILGINGKAQDYPTQFVLDSGNVTRVVYGNGAAEIVGVMGTVTVGIVNHEQQTMVYRVELRIDGQPGDIYSEGVSKSSLGPIELKQGEKWEGAIGFAPRHTGENERVEFLLFKGAETTPGNSLHLWIAVKSAQ